MRWYPPEDQLRQRLDYSALGRDLALLGAAEELGRCGSNALPRPTLQAGTSLFDFPLGLNQSGTCLDGINASQFSDNPDSAIAQLDVRCRQVDHQIPFDLTQTHHGQSREDIQDQLGGGAGL